MKLFLASYRLGGAGTALARLVPAPRHAVVIANAADAWPAAARAWAVRSEIEMLATIGITARELDLREHIGDPGGVREILDRSSLVWLRGGNTFVLRSRLAQSGADSIITDLVRSGSIVYGGYSAGATIAAPSLEGIEWCDDPAEVVQECGIPAAWSGLGLVPFRIVPHYRSPGHENPERIEALAQHYARAGIDFRALPDSEVIVIDD
ncbi:Type 1 glutamine amidotransferase-like domain-containing protein [Lolliginicoccus suaedae]|uniref:Type 1 glutamine amidotransferase-like domain-containing protein n=1 Tax=Lolliginicoccus suaedae TaxID=2605429 RepID=UPI0011ED7552|nr:Type 1 glutamine amidotransferase-like domain-containing protein [Lolliginicoccus suaedae]